MAAIIIYGQSLICNTNSTLVKDILGKIIIGQDSVVKFIGYDRYTVRTNTKFADLNSKLRVGENLSVLFDDRKVASATIRSKIRFRVHTSTILCSPFAGREMARKALRFIPVRSSTWNAVVS